jgi:hypothetical protein
MNKNIPIHGKIRPSDEIIHKYEELLEFFLSALKVKIKIELNKDPIDIHLSFNGIETNVERHWVKRIIVTLPDNKKINVRIFDPIIDNKWREKAWHEAYNIQNNIYHHLGKNPGRPKDNDPYWKLWEKLKIMMSN